MVSLRSPWGTEDCYRKRKKGNFVEFTEVPEGVLETCGVHVVTKKRKSFGLQSFCRGSESAGGLQCLQRPSLCCTRELREVRE